MDMVFIVGVVMVAVEDDGGLEEEQGDVAVTLLVAGREIEDVAVVGAGAVVAVLVEASMAIIVFVDGVHAEEERDVVADDDGGDGGRVSVEGARSGERRVSTR